MKAWPVTGLLLLIGCTLDTAPDHTGSKPVADDYPDWRPNALDASASQTAAVSRDAGSSAAHVDAAPAKAETSQPAEPEHAAAGSFSPAAGSGAMDDPPPPAAPASDAAMPSASVDAAVPVTMTMTMTAPPPPPLPDMNTGEGKREAEPPGQAGDHGKGQGEDHGNHGKGEGERVDAGSPMTERPPAEGMHTAQAALPPQSLDVVTSVLDFVVGVVDGSVATQLVLDLLVLAGSPNDAVVAAVLTEGLHALDDSHACRGAKSGQCLGTCELLASDCSVCAGDVSCLEALANTCGKASVRACP